MTRLSRQCLLGASTATVMFIVGALGAASASATTPAFAVNLTSVPTVLAPGGTGRLIFEIHNLGDAPAIGATNPIVISDHLPAGVTVTGISTEGPQCDVKTLRCEYLGTLNPYAVIQVVMEVEVSASPGTLFNEMDVSGGGAVPKVSRESLTVSEAAPGFGVERLKLEPLNEDGSLDTQAGSHPFELVSTLMVNNGLELGHEVNVGDPEPFALTKDLHFNLPAGLIGNPQVIPQCTSQEFDAELPEQFNACPAETAIGVALVNRTSIGINYAAGPVPLYNLVPSVGEPARFGFDVDHVPIILDTSVRTGGDYGVVVSVNNISQIFPFFGAKVAFWGVPSDPRHNSVRGWDCLYSSVYPELAEFYPCTSAGQVKQTPFLTLPTSCLGPVGMRTTVEGDSWTEPGVFKSAEYQLREGLSEPLGLVGCNRLPFDPSIVVAPDGEAGSTPTGLTVDVHVPQTVALNPTGLSPAEVRNTTVTLPAGIQISPAGADGLESCSMTQIGLEEHADPTCPAASKIATAEIKTPLLPNPLVGQVYLAAQNANPFGSLVAMYIVAKDPVSGVLVKIAGEVTLDPVTGQLVSTFRNTPQLPFEDLTLHFFGSARAPLTTPAACGTYTTDASIAPWSGNEPAAPSSSFQISSGPNGGPCSTPQPFTPDFQAGSTNLQAGAFTPFTLTMSRPDGDQTLSRVEMQMPPGLLGTLSTVKLCPEPQAAQGTCGEDSLIGRTVVSVGLGNDPYTVTGGKVYITTGYKGAPYGLSIVNPAVAGPFDLGTVVVRASVAVDPHTAALTIKSDPLPTILDGIPLQIQHVNITVDRAGGFTFNPTNCSKTAIDGILTSTEGASSTVSTSFQVTNCARLKFKPKFAVSASGKASKAKGVSLHAKLTYPADANNANIKRVKVELPKQLPSRLATLQKACLAKVFDVNPANCPPGSIVGHAKAITPIIPVPLEGPAYFVSHGGEAFPDLTVVLQGYGVTLDLVGTTFISKSGITSTTFKAVPDAPVGTFELTLPAGPFSALGSYAKGKNRYLLCGEKLVMPTEFVAQNGAEIHEVTPITMTGCAKQHARKSASRAKRARSSTRARAARTFSISESGHLHLTSHHGFTLNEQGSATGTIPGKIYIHLNIVSTNRVTAEVNIYPSGGSLTGKVSAAYRSSAGANASFNGTMTILRGTGRYAHARGQGLSFTGTIRRIDDAITVRLTGRMSA
jgi:hypothetical protein